MSVRCDGADCGRPLRLPELAALSPGQWRVLGVPLKCFAATGADTTRITAPFRVSTGGSLNISMSREIGTASCRDRVCQYVEISVVSVPLKPQQMTSVRELRISDSV